MLGFVVGSFCLIALIKLHRMRRMAWAHGCGAERGFGPGHGFGRGFGHEHGHSFGGGRGFGFGGGMRRRGLFRFFEAIEATPGQEKVILAAIDEVQAAARETRGELKQSRADLAQAFRAASFDAEVMGNAFARHDEHIERLRKAIVGALAKTHDALDERQRARLAEWLDASGGFGPFGFGIYR